MGKTPLKKFAAFAAKLFPHEIAYLKRIEQFADAENKAILDRLLINASSTECEKTYDLSIDKRKYSKIKGWIQKQLATINVDRELRNIQDTEYKILTDDISPEVEGYILDQMKKYRSRDFHFIRFYELVDRYRQYLLVRMRYRAHDATLKFIDQHRVEYQKAKRINRDLYQVTHDIVEQYRTGKRESKQWEPLLKSYYLDDDLDGLNRYTALVRLTFIHINYRDFEELFPLYEHLDQLLTEGKFYSRTILANYYSNRVIIHSKREEWNLAENYGYLSITHVNKDYLQYVNTLTGILLRKKKYPEALQLMQKSLPRLKETNSSHNRSGFASFYIHTLQLNQRPKQARKYAESFLRLYKKEIFEHRWHTFFSFYLKALISLKNWEQLLIVFDKYDLLELDKKYQQKANYLPTLPWFHFLASFKLGHLDKEHFLNQLYQSCGEYLGSSTKRNHINSLCKELQSYAPAVFSQFSHTYLQSNTQ